MSDPALAAIVEAARQRFAYLNFLEWLAGRVEFDPAQYADAAAAELRHIATTNLTGAE